MIVVADHRCPGADMLEQLGGHPCVFGENPVGLPQRVCSARAEIAEIPDRRRDDAQAWVQTLAHISRLTSSNSIKKESSSGCSSSAWGEVRWLHYWALRRSPWRRSRRRLRRRPARSADACMTRRPRLRTKKSALTPLRLTCAAPA